MYDDWLNVHYKTLQTVNSEVGIKYFGWWNMPGSYEMLTEDKFQELLLIQLEMHNNL